MAAYLDGELGFERVPHWLAQADALITGPVLDLGRVTRADSAGLALLLELQRRARASGRTLSMQNAPEQLVQLARFFGLDAVLAFES